MKTLHKITVLAVVLGTTGLTLGQTTETVPTPLERDARTVSAGSSIATDNDDDSGNWGLAGLLGLLGLLGMRRNDHDHTHGRGTTTR